MSIRVLEKENNKRGDLFGRLMADLFVGLGYEQPRMNIQKSGREIDLTADHRLESRRAIAECKATRDPIGGDELNKFDGILNIERSGRRVTGYFISLAGFKETAVEQEQQRRPRIVLLDAARVVHELIKSHTIVSRERASDVAGRLIGFSPNIVLDDQELLAHERGWIWTVFYAQGKIRTHFALVHADGTPLASSLAESVIEADRNCGGSLCHLTCINPPAVIAGKDTFPALENYRRYIESECGSIHLDGLPADSDVGSRRLKLETIFVPLHFDLKMADERLPVGSVLKVSPRIAILAPPGGGKSTLLKRLAVAFADHSRRTIVDDDLPNRNWFPLFFRCRELRGLARGSFADLLDALSERDPVRHYKTAFRAHADLQLLNGNALILVDGLDEIADPGDRAAFVCTLRTAIQAYPETALVITSREAGFRHVAAHLASICARATISSFDNDDIRRLTVAWHCEVIGDTEQVRNDARALATKITKNDRIKQLAINPLLLTTLLLVKRWVGSLPTRRAVLYGKAVEVLLMTWNTEGHKPILQEEALPQLCYVAAAMMMQGIQKISRVHLAQLLHESRAALPTELGYVKETADQFIQRIEDRSSLLMMSGHDVENGQLLEFFEFRHLTFQEFLTARAMVEGWYPDRSETATLTNALDRYLNDETWREVIPIAAVLGGKATEQLIQRLTAIVTQTADNRHHVGARALIHCIADEAAASPVTIRFAVQEIIRFGLRVSDLNIPWLLSKGKYGSVFREESGKAFMTALTFSEYLADGLTIAVLQDVNSQDFAFGQSVEHLLQLFNDHSVMRQCEGGLAIGRLAAILFNGQQRELAACSILGRAVPFLAAMLETNSPQLVGTACYALRMVATCGIEPEPKFLVTEQLMAIWAFDPDKTIRRLAANALGSQPIGPQLRPKPFAPIQLFVEGKLERFEQLDIDEQLATVSCAWHLQLCDAHDLGMHVAKLRRAEVPSTGRPTIAALSRRLPRVPPR